MLGGLPRGDTAQEGKNGAVRLMQWIIANKQIAKSLSRNNETAERLRIYQSHDLKAINCIQRMSLHRGMNQGRDSKAINRAARE